MTTDLEMHMDEYLRCGMWFSISAEGNIKR